MLEKIKDLIFLSKGNCYLCREEFAKRFICWDCYSKLKIQNTLYGKEISGLDRVYISTFYNRFIREKLAEFKYREGSYLYRAFGEIMLDSLRMVGYEDIDLIVPIPIYRTRENSRGYNQAELLAEYIGRNLNIDYSFDLVEKHIETRSQNSLNSRDRLSNLRGAFRLLRTQDLKDKKILLIDDVLTTGSTLREVAKVLNTVDNGGILALTLTSTYI